MKELKFRLWNKIDSRMEKAFTNDPYDLNWKLPRRSEFFIVMQYTGLKDKDNRDIYEGDILEFNGIYSIVQWQIYHTLTNGGHGEKNEQTISGYKFEDYYGLPHLSQIIGNIYENPEYLAKTSKIF